MSVTKKHNCLWRAASVLLLALACLSCSDDSSAPADGGTSDADGLTADAGPPLGPAPFPAAFLVITSPTGRDSLTTDQQQLTLAGIAEGELTSLAYALSGPDGSSSGGSIEPAQRWQITVELAVGDNLLQVTGTDAAGESVQDSLTVTVNPGLSIGRPLAEPDTVIRGATNLVSFSVTIDDSQSSLVADTVRVVALDSAGQPTPTVIAELADDGQNGDALAGDGLYSAQVAVDDSADRLLSLRVAADTVGTSGPRTAYSEIFSVNVTSPLTVGEIDALEAAGALAEEKYTSYSQTMEREEAAAQLVDDLLALPDVAEAGVSPSGYSVWWEMSSGLPASFSFYPEGTHGGCSDPPPAGPKLPESNALLLEPFQSTFGKWEEMSTLDELLQKAFCPAYDPIHKKADTQATLNVFREMDDHGVVVLSSHGGVWRNQVFFITEIKIERSQLTDPASPYLPEIRARPQRLTWSQVHGRNDKYWSVLPAFVYRYNTAFAKNAVIHATTCSSSANGTMAAAFIAGGAGVYSGFTDTVSNFYGMEIIKPYFQALVDGATVKEAWEEARRQAGNYDRYNTSAQFVYTPQGGSDIRLAAACHGYTRIQDHRDYTFGGSANSHEQSTTRYFSSDRVVQSPYDPRGNTYLLETVHKTCSFSFEKRSTLPGGGLTRTEEGYGELNETYEVMPENLLAPDPDARYGVTKLEIDRESGTVKLYPTPQEFCTNREDWVLRKTTSYSYSPPDSFEEMGGCSFYGGMTDIPGFNNGSDYIEIPAANVEITEGYVRGSFSVTSDAGTGAIDFYYQLDPN